jgi:hypothetical protein
MTDTTVDTISRDNLIAVAPKNDLAVTVAISQTLARGCVMGLVKYAAGTAAADESNTGNGTLTSFALAAGGPQKIGDYIVKCVEAITNSGRFHVLDPDGILIGEFTIPAGAGNDYDFSGGGISFTVTDDSTDFALDDFFTCPIEAGSGQAVACDHTATNGSEVPEGVLVEAVTTDGSSTQASLIYTDGTYQSAGLTFGGSSAYTDLRDAMRDKGMFIVVTNSSANLGG